MNALYAMVRFFVAGGPFMYPILMVFAVGIAIGIERYITLTQVRRKNEGMWNRLEPALAKGDFDKARQMTSKDDSTVSRLLGTGLARQGAVRRREDIEIAMEESMMEIIPQLEKRTAYVALGANIATLLGLLGTIIGLHRPDPRLHGGGERQPGGKGRPPVRQHLGRDEHDGVRADHRDPAAGDALGADRQDGRDRRQPRDGLGQGAERHHGDGQAPGLGVTTWPEPITTGAARRRCPSSR